MVPEAAVAMLACARIGAMHSVVFGGFSAEALRDRMNDAQATVVVTADGGYRRGAIVLSSEGQAQAPRVEGRTSEIGRSVNCRAFEAAISLSNSLTIMWSTVSAVSTMPSEMRMPK
jgi:acetyl-CoA synthetase